jgi:4-hydroxythreonine-4-phosphate dehydrogenase
VAVVRIAITSGEPAGIGPDITLAAAFRAWDAELVVYADKSLLADRARLLALEPEFIDFDPQAEPAPHQPGRIIVSSVPLAAPVHPGELNASNAGYVLDTLGQATAACVQDVCQAMVTAPVQKSVINDAGIPFSGHTEFLAEQTGTAKVVMMLATDELRVALASTHLPLRNVSDAITQEGLEETLVILHSDLQSKFGIQNPKIAVLGLNPHAGEGGHLGSEEIDTIIPALEKLRSEGMNLVGPLPADTAFNPHILETCDAILAMYHDQGLPVLKYAGFGKAINITLGLPIVRTSVDHGTALDLAGSGNASIDSMLQAISSACHLAASGQR